MPSHVIDVVGSSASNFADSADMAAWHPWQEMHRLRHDIDRAFAHAGWRNGGRNGHPFPTAFLPGRAARAYPLVNVSEDAHALYVTALAPGLDPAAIQLTVQDNRLTMAGGRVPQVCG
jgi:HSP20 family protein